MSRRNFDLYHDFLSLRAVHSTWINSVYENAGGVFDNNPNSIWISSLNANILANSLAFAGAIVANAEDITTLFDTKMNSFALASKADSSWVSSIGAWVSSLSTGGSVSSPTTAASFSNVNGSGATSSPHRVAMPTGIAAGDLLLSFIVSSSIVTTFSVDANYQLINQQAQAGLSVACAYLIATASNTGPLWSWSGGGTAGGNVTRYTKTDTISPIGNYAMAQGAGTDAIIAAINAVQGGSFLCDITTRIGQIVPTPEGYLGFSVYSGTPSETMSKFDQPYVGQSSNTSFPKAYQNKR